MTERFEAAERAAIDRYCTWLVAAEAELAEGFVVQVAENKRLSEHAAGLDAALIERAAALDSVTGTRWWRLRQAAASLIRKR
jgi:hypothetical protein